jgi:predicted DNA-binding WGR domain protein
MMITLYKTDHKGRLHYYSLDDRQGHLFAKYTFTVNWGMTLTTGREKVHAFDTRREMDSKLQHLIQERVDSGYRVLYSYFRNHKYRYLKAALRKAAVS